MVGIAVVVAVVGVDVLTGDVVVSVVSVGLFSLLYLQLKKIERVYRGNEKKLKMGNLTHLKLNKIIKIVTRNKLCLVKYFNLYI